MLIHIIDGITSQIVNTYTRATTVICEEKEGETIAQIYWKDEDGVERKKAVEDLRAYNIEII